MSSYLSSCPPLKLGLSPASAAVLAIITTSNFTIMADMVDMEVPVDVVDVAVAEEEAVAEAGEEDVVVLQALRAWMNLVSESFFPLSSVNY